MPISGLSAEWTQLDSTPTIYQLKKKAWKQAMAASVLITVHHPVPRTRRHLTYVTVGAEENIWTEEGSSDGRLEETA
jgi:hypothetical protein